MRAELFRRRYRVLHGFADASELPTSVLTESGRPMLLLLEQLQTILELLMSMSPGEEILKEIKAEYCGVRLCITAGRACTNTTEVEGELDTRSEKSFCQTTRGTIAGRYVLWRESQSWTYVWIGSVQY